MLATFNCHSFLPELAKLLKIIVTNQYSPVAGENWNSEDEMTNCQQESRAIVLRLPPRAGVTSPASRVQVDPGDLVPTYVGGSSLEPLLEPGLVLAIALQLKSAAERDRTRSAQVITDFGVQDPIRLGLLPAPNHQFSLGNGLKPRSISARSVSGFAGAASVVNSARPSRTRL